MELKDKVAIVTGSNTGIGRVTAETLARKGARVWLANRSEEKTRPVIDAIRGAGGRAEFLSLDLSDFAKTRRAAESFLAQSDTLDLLVNNAGLAGRHGTTGDGFEITFHTNHLGPYLFTRLLLPAIEKAAAATGEARIVNVASAAHYQAPGIDWDAVRKPTVSRTGMTEYQSSKLANVLFAKALSRRVSAGVHTYSLHPGVVASDVWREVPWGLRHVIKLFMLDNEQGARTTLYCATSDEVRDHSGRYYDKSREKKPSRIADDVALADTLWVKSAEWTGLPA